MSETNPILVEILKKGERSVEFPSFARQTDRLSADPSSGIHRIWTSFLPSGSSPSRTGSPCSLTLMVFWPCSHRLWPCDG